MPPVPNTVRLVPQYSAFDGSNAANVLHFFEVGGDFDQATGDGILDLWQDWWVAVSNANWAIDSGALWQDLREDPPPTLTATVAGANGLGSGDAMPSQCCTCMSIRATTGGRRGAGRIYIPGLGDGDATGAIFPGTHLTAMQSGLAGFALDAATDFGWALAVYSRTDGISRIVQSIAVDGVVDTQRRRSGRLAS